MCGPWLTPALDQFGPTFGDQEPGVTPREVKHLPDPVRREIDTIDHIREFPSQTDGDHIVISSKRPAKRIELMLVEMGV